MIILTDEDFIRERVASILADRMQSEFLKLKLLDIKETCEQMSISERTLRNLKDGPQRITLIPGSCIRYQLSEIRAYIERRKA